MHGVLKVSSPTLYKVGNVYISYKNLEPFNTLFSMSANLVENAHVLGEEVTYKMANKIAFMISAVLVDKSMLSGVDDLAKLFEADSSGQISSNVLEHVTSVLTFLMQVSWDRLATLWMLT